MMESKMPLYPIKKHSLIYLLPFLIILIFEGCNKNVDVVSSIPINKISKLPQNMEFYITPNKNFYLPYQRVVLNLRVKNKGSFEKNININEKDISQIKLTPLSKSNSKYTYHVNWKEIHWNAHGHKGDTRRITWYLPNNWAGIISQKQHKNTIQFNIASPVGYWNTEKFTIQIHIPLEEAGPYNELLSSGCYKFFEHEYSARMYRKNWSTYPQCPKEKLSYNNLKVFIKKYPYSAFTKFLIYNLKKTKRILKNEHTKYDTEDMKQIEQIIEQATSP